MRLAVILGALALMAPLAGVDAQPSAQQQPVPGMILPGKAIGPIELGMTLEQAQTVMAQYGTVETVESPTTHGVCNPDRGVGVCVFDRWQRLGLDRPGTVVFVVTDDARFSTDTGSHKVGQPLLDFLRTFGLYSGAQGTEIRWEGRGLSVDVTASEPGIVVRLIGVFAPRGVSAMVPAAR